MCYDFVFIHWTVNAFFSHWWKYDSTPNNPTQPTPIHTTLKKWERSESENRSATGNGKSKVCAWCPGWSGREETLLHPMVLPLLAFRWHYWPRFAGLVLRLVTGLKLTVCGCFEVSLCSFNGSWNGQEKLLNLNWFGCSFVVVLFCFPCKSYFEINWAPFLFRGVMFLFF